MTFVVLLLSILISIFVIGSIIFYCVRNPMDEEEANFLYSAMSDSLTKQSMYYR